MGLSTSRVLLWTWICILVMFVGSETTACHSEWCRRQEGSSNLKGGGRNLQQQLGLLEIEDKALLADGVDLIKHRGDRSADTVFVIHTVALSSGDSEMLDTIYYTESSVQLVNHTWYSEQPTAKKIEWSKELGFYNISVIGGPWSRRVDKDIARFNSTGLSGLIVVNAERLIVSETLNDRLIALDLKNGTTFEFTTKLRYPLQIAKHPQRETFFVSMRDRIREVPLTGPVDANTIRRVAGPNGRDDKTGFADSRLFDTDARFDMPMIAPQAVSRNGAWLYVADYFNNAVRRVDLAKSTTETIAGGTGNLTFGGDGRGFNRTSSVALTSNACNLFVSEDGGMIHWLIFDKPSTNASNRTVVATLRRPDGSPIAINALALTNNDRFLFAGTGDGQILRLQLNSSALHQCHNDTSDSDGSSARPGKSVSDERRNILLFGMCVGLGCALFILCAILAGMYVMTSFSRNESPLSKSSLRTVNLSDGTTGSHDGRDTSQLFFATISTSEPTLSASKGRVPGSESAETGIKRSPRSRAVAKTSVWEFQLSVLDYAIASGHPLNGKGGAYGDVYKACLLIKGKSTDVAIKVMRGEFNRVKHRQFKTEVNTLMNVQHKNLCKLLGYCAEENKCILVYPFIDGGSLYDRLHACRHVRNAVLPQHEGGGLDAESLEPFNWQERMLIVKQVASCLRYLHDELEQPIVHRDVKTANILVRGRGTRVHAYLSDFGLAKLRDVSDDDTNPHTTTGHTTLPTVTTSGTPGYMPPEYLLESRLTMSSDVFALGVVMLELVTGLKAVIRCTENDRLALYSWARRRRAYNLETYVDERLAGSLSNVEWHMAGEVVELALWCTGDRPSKRPSMSRVVHELERIIMQEEGKR
ncbi:hypothetical protein CBR_g50595 [Chara braunii]|uniref:Protein kinase domain-containing protein n=1 Tax=Chara braunii TaxID=69332 RepID=A0A388M6X4_CHABU|nr:hypothetical protein CBR_g50595 [Chara braunii]|eukprot:GBG90347.1 hypothetical protein CBR_g50595 [Chara braunii]